MNNEKCKVIHYGKNNLYFSYTLGSNVLGTSTEEKDLGVIFSDDLRWDEHIASLVNKANRVLGIVKKTFKTKNQNVLKKLYTSLVRPHLEYASQVWHPFLRKDIARLESVQRRATKIICSDKNLDYQSRLEQLQLTTLEERRIRGDLI